ncbi:MAG: hypothetical protein V3V16_15515 [Melioribacteraceae bacterium]
MDINGVGSSFNRYTKAYKNQENAEAPKTLSKKDKLELSEAAKKLKTEGVSAKEFGEIKSKIESGYYNSDEVTKKVAEEILKEFSKK